LSDKAGSELQIIFSHLHSLFRMVGLYKHNHSQTMKARDTLLRALESHLVSEEQLVFRFLDDLLVANERPLPHESLVYRPFLLKCQDKQRIGSITFLRGVEPRELDILIEALTTELPGAWSEWVAGKELHHILVSPPLRLGRSSGDGVARRAYGASIKSLREIHETIRSRAPITVEQVESLHTVSSTLMDEILLTPGLVLRLSSIKSYDEYTLYHSVNVAIIGLGLGLVLKLPLNLLREVVLAGMLHDVGKSAIPIEILRKTAALDEPEWQAIRRHPSLGAEILCHVPSTNRASMIAAFEHHIRFDQAGYPSVRKNRMQHPISRLVCLADVFDAMTSRRAYKVAIPIEKVCSYTRNHSERMFDPKMVHALETMLSQLNDALPEKEVAS
jgi:HD-GYP domain-containing protein (c-di-GMP phosphodiesterase class II)